MLLKFCGLRRQDDLDQAVRLGAHMCGFIFHPGSPRYIDPLAAGALQSGALLRVGIFVKQSADEILEIMGLARLDLAQLHGAQDSECARRIGAERVIRVLWPQKYASAAEMASRAAGFPCAWYLLDAGVSGGSGQCLNWRELGNLRLERPWFLAGGLAPDNLAAAIGMCRPDGVDLNSGVETAPAVKCHARMRLAAEIVRQNNRQPNWMDE